jgi:hypothetical protein
MRNENDNGPSDDEIEDEMIERDIEHQDAVARGEEDGPPVDLDSLRLLSSSARQHDLEEKRLIAKLGSKDLAKSVMDEFDYMLRLRTGEVIRYRSADIVSEDWIHLCGGMWWPESDLGMSDQVPWNERGKDFNDNAAQFARGIDVRLSDIVWVMDAPYDS